MRRTRQTEEEKKKFQMEAEMMSDEEIIDGEIVSHPLTWLKEELVEHIKQVR